MCYVISSNTSAIHHSPVPQNSTQGHSQVVDFKGQVVTEAYTGESMVAHAMIYIVRLREARSKPAMTNLLALQRLSLFKSTYEQDDFYTEDNLISETGDIVTPESSHFMSKQTAVIERLKKRGVI